MILLAKSNDSTEKKITEENKEDIKKQVINKEINKENDDSLDEIEKEALAKMSAKYSEEPKGFAIVFQKHKLLSIFYYYNPFQRRLTRATMLFLVFLGQMFFIGLFYQDDKNSAIGFYDKILEYSLRDFLVMLYSNIIMLIIEVISLFLLKEKEINKKMTLQEAEKIAKRNKYFRAAGLGFSWIAMGYFSWSISMFALHFSEGTSHIWLFNTGVSFIFDLLFTSIIKLMLYAFVIAKIIEYFKKRKLQKELEMRESYDPEDASENRI
ncbi:hypothetical protein SteCoe_15977 [Stentor coeruleus]|uniref:Uncharacterized protein n=1 Tax=Stentor coeruleus TaxID=5963 RepID=A0A1R2C2G1_9CILI|nr:hypothetical protein SteCoe_15977 [Stentor coeruleus]